MSRSEKSWSASGGKSSINGDKPDAISSTTSGPLAESGKLDVIAIGETQAEAEQALLADLPRRLAL